MLDRSDRYSSYSSFQAEAGTMFSITPISTLSSSQSNTRQGTLCNCSCFLCKYACYSASNSSTKSSTVLLVQSAALRCYFGRKGYTHRFNIWLINGNLSPTSIFKEISITLRRKVREQDISDIQTIWSRTPLYVFSYISLEHK